MGTLTWKQLRKDMEACEQTSGQSVFAHGKSVYQYLDHLNELLLGLPQTNNLEWKLPDWFKTYRNELETELYMSNITYWYATYHDCGKPYCKALDEDGKSHFPNHAESSYQTWLQVNQDDSINLPEEEIRIIGELILHDMDLHTMNAAQVDDLINKLSVEQIVTLLITALAEVHSNAAMFGGIESQSFKMKYKQIERRGRQICKKLFEKGL